jgi:hypothetical protein
MNILFRAYFGRKKISRRNLSEILLGSGSGSGRFRKSDSDPVKNRPDPQHCCFASVGSISISLILFYLK